MSTTKSSLRKLLPLLLLVLGPGIQAQEVFLFPLNEGSGATVTNSAKTLEGYLGTLPQGPTNIIGLEGASPSGQPGDGSITNFGNGFLIAEDATRILNITNGPITVEAWIKRHPDFVRGVEGILSYGNSYKFGLKGSELVFTLLGQADITNSLGGFIPVDTWVHVAAAWTPGSGVNFYVNGAHNFVEYTNYPSRPTTHNYLSIGSEGLANVLVGSFDRVRIHNAVLSAAEMDSEPLTAKPAYATTLVSYDFNQTSLPATNSLTPILPAGNGALVVPTLTGPVWTNGVSGGAGDTALFFDGTRRVIVPDRNFAITGNGVNGNYTLETWVKLPTGFNPNARMILFQYEGQPGFALSINTGRTLHTTTFGKSDINSTTSVVPNDGQWHHVAVVHTDGVNMKFYIDGLLTGTSAYVNGAGSRSTYNLAFGATPTGGNPFTGSLDRIRFSNDALSPGQFDYPSVAGTPFISTHPTSRTVTVTSNTTFSVAAYGAPTLTYQWRFSPAGGSTGRTNLPGATVSDLVINNVQAVHDGYYSVVVANGVGSVESSEAKLTVSTAPTISQNPTNLARTTGETAEFSVAAASAPGFGSLSYRWRYATFENPNVKTDVPGATGATLALNGLVYAQQGLYSVVVSNEGGVLESSPARLHIGTLRPLWRVLPGERAYITGYSSSATTRDLERGMAYNKTTDHLLIGARYTSTDPIKGIYVLEAQTGAEVGQLANPGIVSGGTIYMTRVVAAEDGAIYACNFGTLSDTTPLKIYRWGSETDTTPVEAYRGNPVSGTGLANQQWGKNMSVRGSGANTQILMDNRNFLAVFTTTDGTNFAPTLVQVTPTGDLWNLGVTWGRDNTFWGRTSGQPLYQFQWSGNAATVLRSYPWFTNTFGNFSFSDDGKYLVGLKGQDFVDAVEVYAMSDLEAGPRFVASGLYTADNPHTVGYGNVHMSRNRLFALNPNNGLSAFWVPRLDMARDSGNVVLFWPSWVTDYLLEATETLNPATWSTVPHSVQGTNNVATQPTTGPGKFFRLRGQ